MELLPDGSCDCHVHVYGPSDKFWVRRDGKFAPERDYPVEELLALWDAHNIARGVIVHAGHVETLNAASLFALREFPERLRGVAIINAATTDHILDDLTDAGFKGARFNMLRQDGQRVLAGGSGWDDLKALAPRMAERGWHAQLWIESSDLRELSPELEKLPLDFVIDHQTRTMADKGADNPGFQWFCDRLKSGRYWCKLSGADRNTRTGSPYADTAPFMAALVKSNPDRLVWGSDWPHVGHERSRYPDDDVLIRHFKDVVGDEAVLRKILVDNAETLYGFPRFDSRQKTAA